MHNQCLSQTELENEKKTHMKCIPIRTYLYLETVVHCQISRMVNKFLKSISNIWMPPEMEL